MATTAFQTIITIGNKEAKTVVIFLHGSGGGHEEIADYFECFNSTSNFLQRTKIIIPAAKSRRYTLCGGEYLPVWFDRNSISANCIEDMSGLSWTVSSVHELARSEKIKGAENIFIGGFSQGACAALYCGYQFLGAFNDSIDNENNSEQLFKGVISMSSFLCDSAFLKIPEDCSNLIPLCFTTNDRDEIVPEYLSERTLNVLRQKLNVREKLHCGDTGHWLNDECVNEMLNFIDSLR